MYAQENQKQEQGDRFHVDCFLTGLDVPERPFFGGIRVLFSGRQVRIPGICSGLNREFFSEFPVSNPSVLDPLMNPFYDWSGCRHFVGRGKTLAVLFV